MASPPSPQATEGSTFAYSATMSSGRQRVRALSTGGSTANFSTTKPKRNNLKRPRRFSNPEEVDATHKLAGYKQLTRSLSSISPGSRSGNDDEESLDEELMELHKQVDSEVNNLRHLEEDFKKDLERMNQGLGVEENRTRENHPEKWSRQLPELSHSTLALLATESFPQEGDLLSVDSRGEGDGDDDSILPEGSQDFVEQLQTMLHEAEARLDHELKFPDDGNQKDESEVLAPASNIQSVPERTRSNASSTGSRTPTRISHLIDMFDQKARRSSAHNSGANTPNRPLPIDSTGKVKEAAESITAKVEAIKAAQLQTPTRSSTSLKSSKFTKTPPTVMSPDQATVQDAAERSLSVSIPALQTNTNKKTKQKTLALDDYFNANHQYKRRDNYDAGLDCNTTISSITTHTSYFTEKDPPPPPTMKVTPLSSAEHCDTTADSVTSTTHLTSTERQSAIPQQETLVTPSGVDSPPPPNNKATSIISQTTAILSSLWVDPRRLRNLFYRHQSWVVPIFGMVLTKLWSPTSLSSSPSSSSSSSNARPRPLTFSLMPTLTATALTLFSFQI